MPTLIYKSINKSVRIHWTLEKGDDEGKLLGIHLAELLESIGIGGSTYILAQTISFTPSDEEIPTDELRGIESALNDAAWTLISAWDEYVVTSLAKITPPHGTP